MFAFVAKANTGDSFCFAPTLSGEVPMVHMSARSPAISLTCAFLARPTQYASANHHVSALGQKYFNARKESTKTDVEIPVNEFTLPEVFNYKILDDTSF